MPIPEAGSCLAENLPMVRQVVRSVCGKRGLHAEADDLFSELAVKLLDRDGAVLKQFAERGNFEGFLVRIAQRLAIDYRRRLWGRWRPSARARRLGPAAVQLDRLMRRDQMPMDEAIRHTASAFGLPGARVAHLQRALGATPARRAIGIGTQAAVTVTPDLEAHERLREAACVRRALAAALRNLDEDDRSLLCARYAGNQTITAIASDRGLNRKILYRRFDRLHATLRESLVACGIDRQRALSVLHDGIGQVFARPLLAGAPPDSGAGLP